MVIMGKNYSYKIICILLIFGCSKNIKQNNSFVNYLKENKQNISIFLINEEATAELNKNEMLIEEYEVPDNNKLLGWYKIKDNWEETFFSYCVIQNEIVIGKYISNIKIQKKENNFIVTCVLDTNGNKIFNEFTINNIGRNIAIVLDNKIIIIATILQPVKNIIVFMVDI
jgi:preprotein translocase subunit SecD